jgi:hypothetical protein
MKLRNSALWQCRRGVCKTSEDPEHIQWSASPAEFYLIIILCNCFELDTGWKIQKKIAEFSVKNLVCFPSIFSWKLGGKPKTFSPFYRFKVKNSKEN